MFTKTSILCLSIAVALCFPSILSADDIVPLYSPKASVMLLASSLSYRWGVNTYAVKYVLKHESGYNQNAIGDYGQAQGVAQYHSSTFSHYEALYFKSTGQHLSYHSANDQVTLMVWQWKTYPQSRNEWSTYRMLQSRHG